MRTMKYKYSCVFKPSLSEMNTLGSFGWKLVFVDTETNQWYFIKEYLEANQ